MNTVVRFRSGSSHVSRGQVLANTVVTALIVAIIAAGLMRLVFMRYTAAAKVTTQVKDARCVQMAVGQFFSYWGQSGGAGSDAVCSGNPGVFSCSGTVGQCSCSCTFSNGALAGLSIGVSPGPQGGSYMPCTFTVATSDALNPPAGCQ